MPTKSAFHQTSPEQSTEARAIPIDDVISYSLASLKGVGAGLYHFVEMAKDPWGKVIDPSFTLLYDSAVIYAAHAPHNNLAAQDYITFQNYVLQNQPTYLKAVERMEARMNGFKSMGEHLRNADGPHRAEMIAEGITGIFAPGFIFKGIRASAAIASNVKNFGTMNKPPLFHNTINDRAFPAPEFDTLNIKQVRATLGEGSFLFVYTVDKELLVAAEKLNKPVLRDGYESHFLHHHELAQGKPVYLAGVFETYDGFIRKTLPRSGHFLPEGSHLASFMEKTLHQQGYSEALGTFTSIPLFAKSKNNPKMTQEKINFAPGKETLFTTISSLNMNQNINYQHINTFAEHYYDPMIKYNTGTEDLWFANNLKQGLEQSAWYADSRSSDTLEQLSNQIHILEYIIHVHAPYFSSDAKAQLDEVRSHVQKNIEHYKPKANEIGDYLSLKETLDALSQPSKKNAFPELSSDIKAMFQAKTPEELKQAYQSFLDDHHNAPRSADDEQILSYLSDHFGFVNGILDSNQRVKLEAQLKIEKAWDNGGQLLQGLGQSSMELGRLSATLGNAELGKALIVSGSLLQGASAVIMFQAASGAAALMPLAGIIGAATSIVSNMLGQSEDGLGEALQAIYQQLICLRQDLHHLRQEVFELRKFSVEFRAELFERLSVYFDTVDSKLLYAEEIARNNRKQTSFQIELGHEGTNAVLAYLKDNLLYEVRSYYEGITDVEHLTQETIERYLQQVRHQLDNTLSAYESGAVFWQTKQNHDIMAALPDIQHLLTDPKRRGKLFGYVASMVQQKNASSPIMNPVDWSALVNLYIFLRRLPLAHEYDKQFKELQRVKTGQGERFIQFVNELQKNIIPTIAAASEDVKRLAQSMIAAFEYPALAHNLIRHHDASSVINTPDPVFEKMFSKDLFHFNKLWLRPLSPQPIYHGFTLDIPNEFLILASVGLGRFEVKHGGCPLDGGLSAPEILKDRNIHTVIHNHQVMRTQKLQDPLFYQESIVFHYLDKRKVTLIRLDFRLDHEWIRECWHVPYYVVEAPNAIAEARQMINDYRKNITLALIDKAEQTLPAVRDQLVEAVLNLQGMLTVAGLPDKMVAAMPTLTYPSELSLWLAPYRADSKYTDIYRPLPNQDELIKILNNYTKNFEEFLTTLTALIKNDTQHALFSSQPISRVSAQLIRLEHLREDLLFAQNISRASNKKNASATAATPSYATELAAVHQRLDLMTQELQKITATLAVEQQEKQLLKAQLHQLLDLLMPKAKTNNPVLENLGVNAVEIPETQSITLVMLGAKQPIHKNEWGTCWISNNPRVLSADQMLCVLDGTNKVRLVRKLNETHTHLYQIANDHYHCDADGQYCKGEKTEFVEAEYSQATQHPNLLNIAIYSAISAAAPEAIGDLAALYGYVSPQRAAEIKWMVVLSLMLFVMDKNDWCWLGLGLLASYITENRLTNRGVSKSHAQLAGNVVGFFVNAKCKVPTQSNMIASVSRQVGFWAEKKIMHILTDRKRVFDHEDKEISTQNHVVNV